MKPFIILILLALLASCAAPSSKIEANPVSPARQEPTAQPSADSYAPISIEQGSDRAVHLIDLSSGLDVPGFIPLAMPAGTNLSVSAASTDASRLALVSGVGMSCQPYAGGSTCYQAADTLHLVDTAGWAMLDVPLPGNGHVSFLSFNPDGSRLALAYNIAGKSSLHVFDTSHARELAHLALDYQPEWLAFVLEGKTLAVYGVPPSAEPGIAQPGSPVLQLLDPESLQPGRGLRFDSLLSGEWCHESCDASPEQRRFALWKPGLALSPDGKRLYIIHADQERLSTIDLAHGAVRDDPIELGASWLERLLRVSAGVAQAKGQVLGANKIAAVSPDGKRLYVLTENFSSDPRTGQKLQVIGLPPEDAGVILASANLNPDRPMHALQPASVGDQLWVFGSAGKKPLIQAVSAASLEPSADLIGWEITPGPGVLLGRRARSSDSELAIIDSLSLEVLRSWQVDGEATWLPFP